MFKRFPESEIIGGVIIIIICIIACILGFVVIGFGQEIDIEAVIEIESNGNPSAINQKSGAIGLLQITPICLKEYNEHRISQREPNNIHTTFSYGNSHYWDLDTYEMYHLFVPEINLEIGSWYLDRIKNHYCKVWNIPATTTNILAGWNWGVGNLRKWHRKGGKFEDLPLETRKFILTYRKITEGEGYVSIY